MYAPEWNIQCDGAVPDERRMIRACLLGHHSHETIAGVTIHIWKRGCKYLARGSYEGRRFGETLGATDREAVTRLHQLLVEIETGAFVAPSEARKRPFAKRIVAKLTLRQLCDDFLAEKRAVRGQQTSATYLSRLRHVLDFAEACANIRRWPLAQDVDRQFVIKLRAFLHSRKTTSNGRPGGTAKLMSPRQVGNVLENLRTALAWARRADVRRLPADWENPLTQDLVGVPPAKDPLRADTLPMEARLRMVPHMDRWQLCQLGFSMVLPLRPDEAAGLLVSDVDLDRNCLTIGTRMGGNDRTKGQTSFKLPFPAELRPMVLACIGRRRDGPLLRSRRAFERGADFGIQTVDDLRARFEDYLLTFSSDDLKAEQDRKQAFRRFLRTVGGVSKSALGKEFKKLVDRAGVSSEVRLYSLRHANTQGLKQANVPHLEMLYLTGHSTNNILNVYTTLDPFGAMEKYFETIRPLLTAVVSRARGLFGA